MKWQLIRKLRSRILSGDKTTHGRMNKPWRTAFFDQYFFPLENSRRDAAFIYCKPVKNIRVRLTGAAKFTCLALRRMQSTLETPFRGHRFLICQYFCHQINYFHS
jgi:hypothetical protein